MNIILFLNLKKETVKYVFEQASDIIFAKYDIDNPSEPMLTKLGELEQSYEASIKGEGARKALDIGNSLKCMEASGPAVNISDKNTNISYIYNPQYDDRALVFNVAAYNKATGSHYTIADMKKEYMGYTEEFKEYQEWYTDHGEEANKLRDRMVEEDKIMPSQIDAMNIDELEAYLMESYD